MDDHTIVFRFNITACTSKRRVHIKSQEYRAKTSTDNPDNKTVLLEYRRILVGELARLDRILK